MAADRSGHRASEQQPVSESARHLSRVRVTDSGHRRNETANSAAATAGRRTYAGPGGFQVAATTGGPGTGHSRQDSRTAPATSVWPAVADGSPAEHAPQATGGLGGSSSRLGGRRAADPPAAEPRQSSMPRHWRIRTQTEDVRHRQQQPVRTGSAVSQYEQPPEGGSPPGQAGVFHVCQVRRAGPWDTTAAGQPGRTAASVRSAPRSSCQITIRHCRRVGACRRTSQITRVMPTRRQGRVSQFAPDGANKGVV